MDRGKRWPGIRIWLGLGLFVAVGLWTPGRASAQMGFGYGMGFGLGFGLETRPMSVENIYSRANMAGGHAFSTRQETLTAPQSFRDLGYSERNASESRRDFDARIAAERRQRQASQGNPAAAAAPPTAQLPLAGFFDAYGKLVWPADAPTSGDLKAKRDASDAACAEALGEVKSKGVASISTTASARNLLLDYGRPALKMIRSTQTPIIAESFHVFLNALYDSLGQSTIAPAATTPK